MRTFTLKLLVSVLTFFIFLHDVTLGLEDNDGNDNPALEDQIDGDLFKALDDQKAWYETRERNQDHIKISFQSVAVNWSRPLKGGPCQQLNFFQHLTCDM